MKIKEISGKGVWLRNFQIRKAYCPELKHGLMGFFPAIFKDDDKRIVVCLSKDLAEKVVKMLPDRKSKIGELPVLANVVDAYCFDLNFFHRGFDDAMEREELRILTEAEFEKIKKQEPFMWAPGLINS